MAYKRRASGGLKRRNKRSRVGRYRSRVRRAGRFSGGGRRRMGYRRRTVVRRVSAPNTTVATTYYTGSFPKNYKSLLKRYKMAARNMELAFTGDAMLAPSGQQNMLELVTANVSDFYNYFNTVGQVANPGGTGYVVNTARMLIISLRLEQTYTNASNTTAFLDLYHYVAKRDCIYGVIPTWDKGLRDQEGQNTTSKNTLPGVTPNISNAVGDFWKLKKLQHIVLAPGQSHQHFVHIPIMRVIDNEYLRLTPATYLAGITTSLLAVVRGQPMEQTNSGPAVAATTTSEVVIRRQSALRASFKYISDDDTNTKFDGSYTAHTGTANIYNQGSGAIGGAAVEG